MPARPWSKRTDELVRHVAESCRPSLQLELGHWIEASSRFAAFVDANRDKIRKKLRSSSTEDVRMDVRAELVVASLLLTDRRVELAFEAYGSRQPGPDLSATYRTNQRFNIEVTRLRGASEVDPRHLASLIAAKLRQLPADSPNLLVIVGQTLHTNEDDLAHAIRVLKQRADGSDDAYFAARALKDARDFYARYLRLGGVVLVDEADSPPITLFVANREARRPLPTEAISRLLRASR